MIYIKQFHLVQSIPEYSKRVADIFITVQVAFRKGECLNALILIQLSGFQKIYTFAKEMKTIALDWQDYEWRYFLV